VVAKLNGREITISDLRSEMARLGMSPNMPGAERAALESVVNRNLLARAARQAEVHRKPEALRRMHAAQEQALADLYLGTASQPPEPTRTEIEDFILENPSLFNGRHIYTFTVMTLPTQAFDKEDLTALFDQTDDFTLLKGHLKKADVSFVVTPAMQPSNAFPGPVRKQLAEYNVKDNIVIKGETQTQIMKITDLRAAPLAQDQAPAVARRALLENKANERATKLLDRLKGKASLSYYRATAAPLPAAATER